MSWLKVIIYVLFAYGFANMVVYAGGPFGIFERWRNFTHRVSEGFGELFTCMICFSTWIGIAFSLIDSYCFPTIAFTPFSLVFGAGHDHVVIKTMMDMCMTSGCVWLLHNLEEAMERHGTVYETEDDGDISADIYDEDNEQTTDGDGTESGRIYLTD